MAGKKKESSGGSFVLALIIVFALVHYHILPSPSTWFGGGSFGSISAPANSSERAWVRSFLQSIGAPANAANRDSMYSWIAHESPWNGSPPDGALYTNNPLNTTQQEPGSWLGQNGIIQMFPDEATGIAATRDTITSTSYSNLLSALQSGQGICGVYDDFLTWSSNAYNQVC